MSAIIQWLVSFPNTEIDPLEQFDTVGQYLKSKTWKNLGWSLGTAEPKGTFLMPGCRGVWVKTKA